WRMARPSDEPMRPRPMMATCCATTTRPAEPGRAASTQPGQAEQRRDRPVDESKHVDPHETRKHDHGDQDARAHLLQLPKALCQWPAHQSEQNTESVER